MDLFLQAVEWALKERDVDHLKHLLTLPLARELPPRVVEKCLQVIEGRDQGEDQGEMKSGDS